MIDEIVVSLISLIIKEYLNIKGMEARDSFFPLFHHSRFRLKDNGLEPTIAPLSMIYFEKSEEKF
jgi:hypothetical protein